MRKLKELLWIMAGCLCALTLLAGELHIEPFGTITAATNATVQTATTNATYLNGWVSAIDVDIGGTANGTTRVDVVTDASLGAARERTVLSVTSLAADKFYQPRLRTDTIGGTNYTDVGVMFPLVGEKLVVRAYNANLTGVTVNVDVYIESDNR